MAEGGSLGVASSEASTPSAARETPNRDFLDRIPVDARTVLHVGCASGTLAAAFRRMNPKARLLGIESDPAKAAIAAGRLDEVALAGPDAPALPFALPDGIDCLIYDDILARCREPWTMLRRHARHLARQGVVLALAPNAEHWRIAAQLLQGAAGQDEATSPDGGSPRGFTREEIRQGFAQAGFAPVDIIPKAADADLAASFVGAITTALLALGVDPGDYLRRAAPQQFLVQARVSAPERLSIVSTMLAPVGGVSEVRVVEPMRSLATLPGVVAVLSNGKEVPAIDYEAPRIFIFHRPAFVGPGAYRIVEPLLQRGFVVVTEFDDHPDYIPILQTPDMFNFSAVHAVQTTTPALAEILRRDNAEVAVFPNGIRALPNIVNFTHRGYLTLFFGCLNREREWPPYMDALNRVAAGAGERLRFAVVRDNGFFDALQTPHKTFFPTLDYGTYINILSQCDLSFMPLSDTPFNRAKSDLKFIEAAASRVTALASPTIYADSIQDGVTGVLFHDAQELQTRLLQLVDEPDRARSIADAARAWVAEHRMLAYQMPARVAWYRSLWSRRAELNEALLRRLPDLAPAAAGFRQLAS